MTARICECRWHLVDENSKAIRVSLFKDRRSRPQWIGKKIARITKREGDMITFTMDFSEARKRGMI
jgi:hypothetical protein